MIDIGGYHPKFGPYQGGLLLTFEILSMVNFTKQDVASLYCDFDSVERTKLTMINETIATCLQPPSRYIQSVLIRVISTDVTHLVKSNHLHFFEFIADFEFLEMEHEHLIIKHDTKNLPFKLIGRNFNESHKYQIVMRNETHLQSYEYILLAKVLSYREL